MSAAKTPNDHAHEAEAVFAAWAARVESGELPDFEDLVRANAALAGDLRVLHADWKLFAPILGKVVPGLIASESGIVMPSLTGGPEADDAQPPSDELLARLGIHTPAENRYRFRAVLGRGGGGVVLKVWDTKLNRPLAMKVVLGQGEEPRGGHTPKVDGRALSRFVDEARIASQLNHPGIVPVHELGTDETGRAYFTMKLVKGEELARIFEHVRTGTDGWSVLRALNVLLRVCEAMAYAHDRGVIHRDLKPANVMVGSYGEVHVMDWGLARVIGAPAPKERSRPQPPVSVVDSVRESVRAQTPGSPLLTGAGNTFGTPSYMSPEQAKGEIETLGAPTDVYAVGAMLYELLGGEAPYAPRGARVDWHVIVMAAMHGPPKSINDLAPRAPAELVAICEKAMAREAGERYATMKALAADLTAFVEGRVVSAFETGTWAETKKWVQRNKALAAALGATVLAIAVGAASFAYIAKQANANAERADANAALATRLKDEALTRERDLRVLGLIRQVELFDASDDEVEYARRQERPAHEWWLEQARLLHDGRRDDAARGTTWSPGLRDVQEQLARMRAKAKPWTDEERATDRREHPRFNELSGLKARQAWQARMLGLEPWPAESDFAEELAKFPADATAAALNERAWSLAGPDFPPRGEETIAPTLARRAVAAATETERAQFRDTLAWALFRCGHLEEAITEGQKVVEEAQEAQKETLSASQEQLREQIAEWTGPESRARRSEERTQLDARIAELERELGARRTWSFADVQDEWSYGLLSKVEGELHGLQQRIEAAEQSVHGVDAERAWNEVIAAVASNDKYRGVKWPRGDRLTPQLGLVPIGADPETGLWEFAHLATGKPALRGADKKLVLEPETGLVLVLLPGGRVPVEEDAKSTQSPSLTEVDLAPFFLSKYEMTQAQWERLGGQPSAHQDASAALLPATEAALLPATNMTWDNCEAALTRAGWLHLSTEAQWEYGCRAGTTSKWWPGNDEQSLQGVANIMRRNGQNALKGVGQLRANAFGLHDVHGNVWEWCRDAYGEEDVVRRAGDGLSDPAYAADRVFLGGDCCHVADGARSSFRDSYTPAYRLGFIGLRPARGTTP